MKYYANFLFSSIIVICICMLIGCVEESVAPLTPSSNKDFGSLVPKGTISGKLYDRCTMKAIEGAVVSVGYNDAVHSVSTDASGSFAFDNVPAGSYRTPSGGTVTAGNYSLTVSMVGFNNRQTDSTKRYPDFSYFPVTITFTSLVPGDSLGVTGMVGAVICSLATLSRTLEGTVVDQFMQAVPYASVSIFNTATGFMIQQTKTAVDGSFQFQYLENGLSFQIYARSMDGSLEATKTLPIFTCNQPWDSLRAQKTTEQIQLAPVDNVQPFIISISIANNSDFAAGLPIVYTFSEPIKQTPYTRTDLGVGHGTIVDNIVISYNGLKKSQGTVPTPAVTWNSAMTTLTITPVGLVASAKYSIKFADTTALKTNLTDAAGNSLRNNTTLTGDLEPINFTTSGNTPGPAAPANFARRTVQGFFGSLDFSGGVVGLQWDPVVSARSYNLYRSIGNGPFELWHKDVYKIQDTVSTGALVNPQNAKDPLGALSVRFQVRAVSADIVEGTPSGNIMVSDDVKPTLGTISVAAGSAANTYLYTLQFSEPLTTANAQIEANYFIQDPDTVTFSIQKADYLGYNVGTTRYHVQLLISANLLQPAGYSLKVGTGIIDLAGNQMDTTARLYTFSAPPIPVLQSPNNGATSIGVPPVVTWKTSNGARSYSVQVATNAGFTTGLQTFSTTATSYTVPNLTVGTLYYWHVSATNAAGTNGYSATRTFTP